MDAKLVFLLIFSALFLPAQFGKHGPKHGHGRGHDHERGERFGWLSWINTDAEKDYDYEATDPPSEEDPVDWLFDLQDISDECTPNPCRNNGVCEEKNGKFKCDCPKPFKGKRCQRVHKICKRNRCGHGQCVLTTTHPYYECKCREPYQPPNCRNVALCNPGPCQNGASCVPDGEKFECVCPDNFSGKFCQVGPDDCCHGNGESYRGNVSETEDGDHCLFWNSHFILDKGTDPFTLYEDEDGLGHHNHCRNPDGDVKPWCFIKRGRKLRWDYCTVKQCPPSTSPAPSATGGPTGPAEEVTRPAPTSPVTASGSEEEAHTPEPKPTTESEKPAPPSAKPIEANQTNGEHAEFSTCGKAQPSKAAVQRIYGGMKAIPGAHPWQVSLQVRPLGTQYSYRHTCGGVLIKSCWVLTAGHCVDKSNSMRVVLGGVNLLKDEPADQVVEVEKAIVHENYREAAYGVYNDIALLKLKGAEGHCTKETKFVKTACLPNETFPDGSECTISGWGDTETSSGGSHQLLDAKVLLIPQKKCMSSEVYGAAVEDSMVCAGYLQGGVDSCQGDSGGPLVCEKDHVNYIYGLVSWGDSCAKKNKPGVYTRLTYFLDWIKSHMTHV